VAGREAGGGGGGGGGGGATGALVRVHTHTPAHTNMEAFVKSMESLEKKIEKRFRDASLATCAQVLKIKVSRALRHVAIHCNTQN